MHDPDLALVESRRLSREATILKKSGNWLGAVHAAKRASEILSEAGISQSIEGHMRVALLLHEGGELEAAWCEFNRLIQELANQVPPEIWPMFLSAIYDKMRLCLQREKRFREAVPLAVMSFCYDCKGLFLQSRTDELLRVRTHGFFDQRTRTHFKKAGVLDKLANAYQLVERELAELPRLQISALSERIAKLIE
jgi:hypothetical protein